MQLQKIKQKTNNGSTHNGERTNGNSKAHSAAMITADATLLASPLASPLSIAARADHRKNCAIFWQSYPLAMQEANGDEVDHADHRGNFSKGLPHGVNGLVDPTAYAAMLQAMNTGASGDFDTVPTATPPVLSRPFVSPQAGLALEMIGADPGHLSLPPAPKFNSTQIVAEIVENYWMALLRDVHFAEYACTPLVQDAVNDFEKDLSSGSKLRQSLLANDAVAANQPISTTSLFRGNFVGEQAGPYVSQFLLHDCFIGAQQIEQKMRTVLPGIDYMTSYDKWLDVQRGIKQPDDKFDPVTRYIRNGRDLGQWVHVDQLYQAYLLACLQLLDGKAKVSPRNPYNASSNQAGFATFGGPHILSLVTEVATRALKAVWYQKWEVNRRLRPEAFAGRIHVNYLGGTDGQTVDFDIDSAIEEVSVMGKVYNTHGSLLLPMAFPEGSPLHPAYGAGHATVAGACTTILKAWFKTDELFTSLLHPLSKAPLIAKQASDDGLSLNAYTGDDAECLTIEGELNKLAGNIALGRNFAGVHWRSDYRESLLLGEKVAIGMLMDYVGTFNEPSVTFEFNSFTGHCVVVGDHQVMIDGNDVIKQVDSFSNELALLNVAT